ncbi:AAA family ATPase [Sphingomonas sp. MA1305]|uniref:AAA family ATPase n=1 Tax=Sphingomonas sp. MA1305 TaxID=2479204 RepID=UPI0018DF59A6
MSLPVSSGSITLVAGPNGVGKSALLVALYRSLPKGSATYFPGHRQINFNNSWETLNQNAEQLITNLFQHHDAFNRYKGAWAEDQFKSIIRTLLNAEAAYNREFRKGFAEGAYDTPEAARARLSPVDTLNIIFESALLPVRFKLTTAGISAEREGQVYSIDAMSDGERAAFFIAAAMVSQPENNVVLIDEPEKHLHPSITSLLLEASLRARPDLILVVASHDVHLIERLEAGQVIHIRNSTVIGMSPERRTFEAEVLRNTSSLPEDIRTELLGSRSKIVFVEGELGSYDLALYGYVYPGMKVSPRGGCEKVVEAVTTLRGMTEAHWLHPYGLIDGDGRNAQEREALRRRGIFVLPKPTIENVFFFKEMIELYVEADTGFVGGAPLADRLATLSERVLMIARRDRNEIVALRAAWVLERRLSASKLSPAEIRVGSISSVTIDVNAIVNQVSSEIDAIIGTENYEAILQDLPIKRTGLPNEAAKALGATNFKEYCAVILRQFDIMTDVSQYTLASLRGRLPELEEAVPPTAAAVTITQI